MTIFHPLPTAAEVLDSLCDALKREPDAAAFVQKYADEIETARLVAKMELERQMKGCEG